MLLLWFAGASSVVTSAAHQPSLSDSPPTLTITTPEQSVPAGNNVLYREDFSGRVTIAEVMAAPQLFQRFPKAVPSFDIDISSTRAIWARLTVRNLTQAQMFLLIRDPLLDTIDLYIPTDTEIYHKRAGTSMGQHGDVDVMFHSFALPQRGTAPQTLYLRIVSNTPITLPIFVGSRAALLSADRVHIALNALYLGVMVAMTLYNLLVFVTVRNAAYIFYVLYSLTMSVCITLDQGVFPVLFGYKTLAVVSQYAASVALVPFSFSIVFTLIFLEVRRTAPRMYRWYQSAFIPLGLVVLADVLGYHALANLFVSYLVLAMIMLTILVAYQVYRSKFQAARFFLLAWGLWLTGVAVYALMVFLNVFFIPVVAQNIMPVAITGELMLMSFALADHIAVLRREKEEAQSMGLEMLQENARLLRQQQILLEQKVHERTEALEEVNRQLAAANEEIQRQLYVQSQQQEEIEQTNATLEQRNTMLEMLNRELERAYADIHAINEALEEGNEELAALNREKNEILGIVSHDLKNPLTTILSFADMMRQQSVLPLEVFQELAGKIHDAGTRMFTLIKKILDVTALESGTVQFTRVPVHLPMLVRFMGNLYQDRADAKHLTLQYELTPELYVIADETAMNQIVENLLSNAIKYSPPHKRITLLVRTEGEARVQLRVIDEGAGIRSDELPRLFGKFARLSTRPTGGEDSTGLGLSIVKNLVEAMNGRVWCESTYGHGSTFIAEFPRYQTP